MTDRLFPFLLLLTLIDLAFVQATDVVPWSDLLPLWLLTATAPWLRRLQQHLLYRLVWNGGVLLVFALLVRHATTTGLLHMLEDGLMLAVLCQVHLLNNVGEKQRPDLIFFNSFLVGFVTSFFAPDLWWSLLFVLHALVLVPSLEVYGLVRAGRDLAPALLRALLRDSLPRTLAIGAVTAAVFVVWPRDFRREGWLGEALAMREQFEAGISDRIRLDNEHSVRLGEELIAQITAADPRTEVPSHWRTNAFSVFDGVTWHAQDGGRGDRHFATDPAWQRLPDGNWRRPGHGDANPRFVVRLHDAQGGLLPLPLTAVQLQSPQAGGIVLDGRSDGGFAVWRAEDAANGPLQYSVATAAISTAARISARTRAAFTALPDRGVPTVARQLAQQLRAELPADADPLTIAQTYADWLRVNRRYALPGEPGFARNLGEFLLGTGAGHCEYFATALALLLRLDDVPCRLVGGWLVHELDPATGASLVRSKHAHAWVEVLGADDAWHTLDATPAADVMRSLQSEHTWWSEMRADLDRWWAAITGFDQAARTRWLQALRDLPTEHPLGCLLTLAGAAALVYLRRRRHQSQPAIVGLLRALRRAGLQLQPGETPRELLQRAAGAALAPALLLRLQTAARHHEASRYGKRQEPLP